MKISIISNYFPPDLGAASNRIYEMAHGLKERENDVEVISPLPNYPKGKIFKDYRGKIILSEKYDNIQVNRSWIYATVSDSSILRMLSMMSFALTMWFWLFHLLRRKPDFIIIQHSPLLVSLSATFLSKLLPGCKHVLNVSDLWPLSASELGAINHNSVTYKALEKIEKFNYLSSDLLIGQSNEILSYSIEKYDINETFLYRNIPRLEKKDSDSPIGELAERPIKIVYAGLLGVAQGVYAICENISFKRLGLEFHIYGDGNEKDKIKTLSEKGDNNIFYHGSVSKSELHKLLPNYQASIVPLSSRIYGAVPSKIYELILFKILVLFSGEGEGARIIKENGLGFVSPSSDHSELENNLKDLSKLSESEYRALISNCKNYAEQSLNLQKQITQLNSKLKELIRS